MTGRSGCALEPLFDARARDDLLAIAEAEGGAHGAVLVPQPVELRVDRLDLCTNVRVVLGGESMPELSPLLAQMLDLLVDLFACSHAVHNARHSPNIPE